MLRGYEGTDASERKQRSGVSTKHQMSRSGPDAIPRILGVKLEAIGVLIESYIESAKALSRGMKTLSLLPEMISSLLAGLESAICSLNPASRCSYCENLGHQLERSKPHTGGSRIPSIGTCSDHGADCAALSWEISDHSSMVPTW